MKYVLRTLLFTLLLHAGAAEAQNNVNWGLHTESNPGSLGVYDTSHSFVPIGTIDSSSHTFTLLEGGTGTTLTVISGFGAATGIIGAVNGTGWFQVIVSAGGGGSNGVVGLPSTPTNWNCYANDITNPVANWVFQTGWATSSATFSIYTRAGVASTWTGSDVIEISCRGG